MYYLLKDEVKILIKIKNLKKTYESKTGTINALKDISLEIKPGEIFGIIGQSGAGKSTLIRCINRLEEPTSGEVIVDNQDITKLSETELRKARHEIGMIFQHFNLLTSRTIFDNVAFPLEIQGLSKTEIESRVQPLLELVGLGDRTQYFPSQLSGGQKQRVGIARALASNPKVLLCDEATSALDPQTTKSILELLKDINQKFNLTIVLITHEMQVIKEICDKVAVIEGGVIIEQGEILDVFTNPQQQTTKEFISVINNQELPKVVQHLKLSPTPVENSNLILRLAFIGASTEEPIISGIIRRFNVNTSILYGNIDYIKEVPYGTLVVELDGESGNIQEALAYLQEQNLRIEVIGYARRTNIATA